MSGKFALIIGNTEYIDPGLAQLKAPGKDAEDFARVLKDKEIGAFDDVKVIVNEASVSVIEAIDEFFDQKKPDDMLVLYFSGHGIRDEIGSLYLAFKNTIRSRLRSTAIKSDYIKEAMDQSRSKRQVLILDCCNSGAFPQGTKAELGGAMGMTKAFQGYGRFVLTASDATQFAWEGDQVIGETDNSLFTHFLVKGLEGEADSDGDGRITVDELYDYAYGQISRVTPKQTPTKSSSKVEGEIVLRQSTRIENIKPMPLPAELMDEIEDTRPYVREVAVQKLDKIIKGRNIGLARSARDALEKIIADDNTTRRVAQAATQVLESIQEGEQLATQKEADKQKLSDEEEAKRIALRKAEAQRILHERTIEAEHQAKQKAERFATQNAEEERLAEDKIIAERKAREEAEGLARVKAEREVADKAARDKAEQEANLKAALDKIDRKAVERTAREKAERETTEQKASRLTSEREETNRPAPAKAPREAINNANARYADPIKKPRISSTIIVMFIIAAAICGFAAITLLPGILKLNPVPTEPPIDTPIEPTLDIPTEAPPLDTSTADAQATEFAQATQDAIYSLTAEAQATQDAIYNLTAEAQATQDAKSYYDPFNSESGNWIMGELNRSSWDGFTSIDNNTFLINVTQVRDGFSQRKEFLGHVSADFDFTVDSLSESYSATDGSQREIFCHGIYFREVSDSYYVFYVCDQYYVVSYFDGSSWNTIFDFTESTEIRTWDWNKLRVITSGSNFDLYINDTYMVSFSDSRNQNGGIGLWFSTRAEKMPGEIRFDNFILNNFE